MTMRRSDNGGIVLELTVPDEGVLESTEDMAIWTVVDLEKEKTARRSVIDPNKILIQVSKGNRFFRVTVP